VLRPLQIVQKDGADPTNHRAQELDPGQREAIQFDLRSGLKNQLSRAGAAQTLDLYAHPHISPDDVERRLTPVLSMALLFDCGSQCCLVVTMISITGAAQTLAPVVEPAERRPFVRKERKIESPPSRSRPDVVAGEAELRAIAHDGDLVRPVPSISLHVRQGIDASGQGERLRRTSAYQDTGAHVLQACANDGAEEGPRLPERLLVDQLRSQVTLFQANQVP
jgi:hypothetical protein